MSETTLRVQSCLERLGRGDAAARNELLAVAFERMEILARKMLRNFPSVRGYEQTGDVLNSAAERLMAALGEVSPKNPADFFGFAALQIRRVLLDLSRSHGKGRGGNRPLMHTGEPEKSGSSSGGAGAVETTDDPELLALWTKFHEEVERLPADQKQAFDLCWYQDLTQDDAAKLLGVDKSTVKRRFRAARMHLASVLKDDLPGAADMLQKAFEGGSMKSEA